MFIKKREEYEKKIRKLDELERMNKELNEEIQRLGELISAEVKDCKVGPWCKDCRHSSYEKSEIDTRVKYGHSYISIPKRDGRVLFCKKHINEICPEHEFYN